MNKWIDFAADFFAFMLLCVLMLVAWTIAAAYTTF